MIDLVVRMLFRCSHKHLTRPITLVDGSGGQRRGTYVGCLDCGAELPYNWDTMRVARPIRQR